MLKKHLDTILIVGGFILVAANVGYAMRLGAENLRWIHATPGLIGLVFGMIGMALMEMKSGKKTATEAALTVAVEMLLLGLFIFISTLLRK